MSIFALAQRSSQQESWDDLRSIAGAEEHHRELACWSRAGAEL